MRDEDRQRLLRAARAAIAAHLAGKPAAPPASIVAGDENGVFVTLHEDGELRGCIGRLEPHDSLPRTVADCAVLAATADPRFPAVSCDEVPRLRIEL